MCVIGLSKKMSVCMKLKLSETLNRLGSTRLQLKKKSIYNFFFSEWLSLPYKNSEPLTHRQSDQIIGLWGQVPARILATAKYQCFSGNNYHSCLCAFRNILNKLFFWHYKQREREREREDNRLFITLVSKILYLIR